MEYRVLGPLAVVRGGEDVPLGSRKQRMLLAVLLVADGHAVADDVIVDALWGASPPPSVQNNLQALVSRLRRVLGAEAIPRLGEGYALDLGAGVVDAQLFADRAAEGADLLGRGDGAAAEHTLREALALVRGEPYADFRYEDFAAGEIARLEELRLAVNEDHVEALLQLGRNREAVSELERLIAASPYHERFRHQLVLALYREGRQADALAAHRVARAVLLDDLGVEPSPEFRALERRILQQDRDLLAAPRRTLRRRSGRRLVVAAIVLAAVAAAVVAVTKGRGEPQPVHADSLVVLDSASGRVATAARLPFAPRIVAAAHGSVWVSALSTNAVVRVDPVTGRVVQTVGLPGTAAVGLAADPGGAWVASMVGRSTVTLERYVAGHDEAVASARWDSPTFFSVGQRSTPLAEGAGALWASNGESTVARFDPVTGRQLAHVEPDDGAGPIGAAVAGIWTAYTLTDTVTRIDPRRTEVTAAIPLAQSGKPLPAIGTSRRGDVDPSGVAVGFGSVWIAAYGIDAVIRIDPESNAILATIPVGNGPTSIVAGAGAVWVANRLGRSVTRIDPSLNAVTATTQLGFRAESIAVADGRVLAVVQGR